MRERRNSGWNEERRKRQSALIQSWRPWDKSTGPRSTEGKERVARNADQGKRTSELARFSKQINAALKQHRTALDDFIARERPAAAGDEIPLPERRR